MSVEPEGYMRDAKGRLVPLETVKPEHLLEDELVRSLHQRAHSIAEVLRNFKRDGFGEVSALQTILHEKHNASIGGAKGNITLSTYDGRLRVTIAIGDSVAFGPELSVAKSLIDGLLDRWSEGANANLRTIVMDAFDVGKEGNIQASKVLALRRLNIPDPEWKRAMDAIADSIRIDSTKSYLRLHQRQTHEDSWEMVPLDLARA
ncbi:MAG: DUF3164 family protein [Acetobacter sp.]|nr:DUF3164 family protein [Acetobacter sp.]